MSGPLSDKPHGTTPYVQVANARFPTGERLNKTAIFISGVRDTRVFLAWLRAFCPGGLEGPTKARSRWSSHQQKTGSEPLSAHWCPPMREVASIHVFTLPEDRCVLLLVKNLGSGIPESVFWEELESLKFRDQGVTQLRSGRHEHDPAKELAPNTHINVSVAWTPDVSKVQSLTKICGLRVSVELYVSSKRPIAVQGLPAVWTHAAKLRIRYWMCRVWGPPFLRWLLYTTGTAPVLWMLGNHTSNYRGCVKWNEWKATLPKGSSIVAKTAPPQLTEPLRKNKGQSPLPSRWTWAGLESRRPRKTWWQGHCRITPIANLPPQPVTESFEQPNVIAIRKTSRPQKSEPITTAYTKPGAGKYKMQAAASVEVTAAKSTTPTCWS